MNGSIITKNTKFLIVGLGVIGGSYAQALTRAGYTVSCITRSEDSIRYALERKMISYGTTRVEPSLVAEADIIVFALYPEIFIKWIEDNQSLFRAGTIITDVTGVKGGVVKKVQSILHPDVEFIAAHPMAGRERSGVEYSDAAVFKGANYIVTPTEANSARAIATCRELGEILGFARISELSPEAHDEMIAFLSQLTHVIAVTLMTCTDCEGMEKYTGDSFRDLTRISKINDLMWSELFLLNKDALLAQMDAFSREFERFRRDLEAGDSDSMRATMRLSAERRTRFDKK